MEQGFTLSQIDTTTPHPARMYDALLGGKDNYPPDRDAVRRLLRVAPEARDSARANRAFLQRAVRYLAGEAGIRQIIDIGTGIPAAGNVHQVAGEIAPGTRVAYVDNDPLQVELCTRALSQSGCLLLAANVEAPHSPCQSPQIETQETGSQRAVDGATSALRAKIIFARGRIRADQAIFATRGAGRR
jgi:hypothetical protein